MAGLDVFKKVVGWTISAGITKIISSVVENNVEKKNAYDKVTVWVGESALTWVINEAIQDRVNARIDGFVDKYREAKASLQNKDEEVEELPDEASSELDEEAKFKHFDFLVVPDDLEQE